LFLLIFFVFVGNAIKDSDLPRQRGFKIFKTCLILMAAWRNKTNGVTIMVLSIMESVTN